MLAILKSSRIWPAQGPNWANFWPFFSFSTLFTVWKAPRGPVSTLYHRCWWKTPYGVTPGPYRPKSGHFWAKLGPKRSPNLSERPWFFSFCRFRLSGDCWKVMCDCYTLNTDKKHFMGQWKLLFCPPMHSFGQSRCSSEQGKILIFRFSPILTVWWLSRWLI